MSAPVDVLAVMDEFGTDYRTYIPQFYAQNRKRMKRTVAEFDEARAAVAELIEKAGTLATVMSNLIAAGQVDSRYGDHVTDLTAALARVQGGAA